jgi:hypothetical protein
MKNATESMRMHIRKKFRLRQKGYRMVEDIRNRRQLGGPTRAEQGHSTDPLFPLTF